MTIPSLENIIEDYEAIIKSMKEKGIWNEKTTFEEMCEFAAKHIELREK